MTEARKLARSLVDSLRQRRILPATIEQIAAGIAAVYPDDEFVVPLVRKLLGRHANRPGRKRDLAQRQRIAAAAKWARFNNNGDQEKAAADAAKRYGLQPHQVYRAAFERKDADMRVLLRQQAPE